MPRASKAASKNDVDDIFGPSTAPAPEPDDLDDEFDAPKPRARQETPEEEPNSFTPKLGLGPLPGRFYIFIGGKDEDSEDASLWYSLGGKGHRIPIQEPCLVGYLKGLKIVPKLFKGDWNYKLDVTIHADKEYVVRAGLKTTFSKGILGGLMEVKDFSKPVGIAPTPGDENKVVFGNVYDGVTGKKFFHERDEDTTPSQMVFELQDRLGIEVQDGDSIKADKEKVLEDQKNGTGRRRQDEQRDEFA